MGKKCRCTIIEADHPHNAFDAECPVHGLYVDARPTPREMYGDEIADHALAAAYGGINRDMQAYQSNHMSGTAMDTGEPTAWPAGKLRVRAIKEDNTVRIEVDNPPTLEGERILREVLPELLERFLSKNVDYQDFPEADLGPRAHFIGIWRKVCKLKQGLWFGKPLEHEQVSEVIDDTVGHLLLAKLGLLD